jgi:hypothetical protein
LRRRGAGSQGLSVGPDKQDRRKCAAPVQTVAFAKSFQIEVADNPVRVSFLELFEVIIVRSLATDEIIAIAAEAWHQASLAIAAVQEADGGVLSVDVVTG